MDIAVDDDLNLHVNVVDNGGRGSVFFSFVNINNS